MDLCGFDQTVESVCDLTSFDAAHYLKSTGGNRTVLTMNGSASRSSKMVIKDDITVVWNPLSASSVYTFADSAQETTGRFVVKNGEIRFANTSAAKSSGIEVAAGAKFIMDASSSFNPESESLTIEEGASVDFGGRSLKFNVVVYGGKVMPKGSYTHESIPEIAAGSSAVAGEAVAMWNGGAGEGATGIGNAGNWERGMAPDLSAGATLVTFGKGGALATMSGDVAVGGVRFDQQAEGKNSFSVDGTGEFAIGEGGVEVADSSSAKTYGFGVPVKAAASQVWTQRSTVGNRLNFNGGLEIPGGVTVRRNADRSAHLELIGTDERPITIDGKLELDAGFAYLCGGISGSGTLEWWRGDAYTADGDINNLRFLGGIFACDMVWHCENGAKPYQDGTVSFANYTTNVFAGKVTTDSVNQFRPIFGSGSLTEFRGGFDFQYVLVPRGCAGSELVFAGTPGKFSGIVDDTSSYSPHIAFRSAGHDFRSNTITLCGASVIDFEVAGAVKNLQGLNLFGNPQINLHGHDLSAGFIRHSSSYIVNRPHDIVVDSSEGPAKLILDNYQNSAESPIAFTGHAGLRLKGAATGATMTLTAADSTSDGEIELVSGGLKFAADASWRPASRVDVKGGTLTLAHGNVFSKATEVRLEGGTIALDFSGEQEIGILRDANGNQLRRGLYCAMGMTIAGAKPIAGLSGSGTLRVVSKGLMMTIRSKHE